MQVSGTGCPKCRLLTEHAEKAATELGLDFELEKVTDLDRILDFGVVATPRSSSTARSRSPGTYRRWVACRRSSPAAERSPGADLRSLSAPSTSRARARPSSRPGVIA
ncbi:MAG: thioredoxin family protein [Thermoanaerobaculia bacterium]